ncbi:AfsR/SARP family transcriptional regulator [Phytoactinopolyspora halotolerans]|uniref:AAA family ATPase n=1 Tax=Phytoactinopolyspora halotolerans TaxID=1981512 RepID=A0A6L9SGT8_9ACTN|nr:BTAD domain-containing putative transcriptional regulator [Phytoactinopolyspora halotolerans]NEE03642.1 AAA family ATPase [Phytoactinopolyspora halotolerans]
MRVGILGPLQVWTADGRPIEIGAGRTRALLARLALEPGRTVPVDALVEALWGDDPPSGVANSLQSVVSRVRRALHAAEDTGDAGHIGDVGDIAGPERLASTSAGAGIPLTIESRPAGYMLNVDASHVDAQVFEQRARQGRESLRDGDVDHAYKLLADACGLWRGQVLADLPGATFAAGPAARWEELRLAAVEDRNEAALLLGRYAEAVTELEAVAADHPLRERVSGLLIRALAGVGRQADAVAVYERTRRRLADELGLDPSPELREIHLAALRGELAAVGPQTAPASPSADASDGSGEPARRRVPSRLTSFVGREDEVESLAEMVTDVRLATLHGPGGAGKTRLAIELARRLTDGATYPSPEAAGVKVGTDGVWFVELAAVGDALDVAPAVLTALGLGEYASGRIETIQERLPRAYEASRRLVDVLADKDVVLVLDNCEHLVEAVAVLADTLLAACPRLRVVCTSREPLDVAGEQLYSVGPLGLPDADQHVSADDAYAYGAIRLFAERAAAVRPGFRIDEDTAPAVLEICRRLDGMPLAIELAAARVRVLAPEQIAARLDDRFRLLTNGGRTALGRHQTLRAVVEWSWDLLDVPERILLRRLSVFSGGASLDAVESVCAGAGLAAADVLDTLAALVGKSLVEAVSCGSGGEVRYRLLETVRAYGGEQLAAADESDTVGGAHARYFRDLLERAEPYLRRAEQVEWMATLTADYDNLLTALRWAIQHSDADLAIRMVAVLGYYWLLRGTTREGGSWLQEALAVPGPNPPEQRAWAYVFDALSCYTDQGMTGLARSLGRARWTSRRIHSDASTVPAFVETLWFAMFDGRPEVRHRLDPARRSDDPWLRGIGDMAGMFMASAVSDVRTRDDDLAAALAEFRSIGDRMGMAFVLRMRATFARERGAFEEATESLEEALAYTEELGTLEDLPVVGAELGLVKVDQGDFAAARRLLEQARSDAHRYGLPSAQVIVAHGQGWLAYREGDLDGAREFLGEARSLAGGMGDPESQIAIDCARVEIAAGALETAVTFLDEVVEFALRRATARGKVTIAELPTAAKAAEAVASLEQARGRHRQAAKLLGVAALLGAIDDLPDYSPNAERAAAESQAREALGDEVFEHEYAGGAALDSDAALDLLRTYPLAGAVRASA